MRKHRSYPIEFKRQVAQEYLAGETLHGLAKRHEINRNLVRIWVAKYEAGSFDNDVIAAELVQTQEARIAALERLVGKLVLENEFLKGASRDAPRPRSETMPVITGPVASRSQNPCEPQEGQRACARFCCR
jgi:transposase-like protein